MTTKWLHKPRTTDYRHTRHDRGIQTELVSTLAKDATKPNPFEIIPLQTTRKENNWKTEETLETAAVTLETERIKESNRWCLWWWQWLYVTIETEHYTLLFKRNIIYPTFKNMAQNLYQYSDSVKNIYRQRHLQWF